MSYPFNTGVAGNDPAEAGSLRVWTPWGLRAVRYTDTDRFSDKPILLCVPGIARTHRDFAYLATAARKDFRVVSITLLGMGDSERLPSAAAYRSAGWDVHVNSVMTLLAHLRTRHVTFLGTSFGGIIGMILAAQPNSPISALVLNDIGAFSSSENFVGFNEALAADVRFKSIDHAEKFMKIAFRAIGTLTAEEWHRFTLDSIEPAAPDQYRCCYDPNITRQFLTGEGSDLRLWEYWARVACPVLIVRGSESRWLSEATVREMKAGRRNCDSITLNGCGHFPHLRSEEHTAPILQWAVRQRPDVCADAALAHCT